LTTFIDTCDPINTTVMPHLKGICIIVYGTSFHWVNASGA